MIKSIVESLLKMIAESLSSLVGRIFNALSLDLHQFNQYLPGFNVLRTIMLILGLAAVLVCIVTEAISLISTPLTGQEKKGGLHSILRCVIAGILVVFIYSLTITAYDKAINPLYTTVLEYMGESDLSQPYNESREEYVEQYLEEHSKSNISIEELRKRARDEFDKQEEIRQYEARKERFIANYVEQYMGTEKQNPVYSTEVFDMYGNPELIGYEGTGEYWTDKAELEEYAEKEFDKQEIEADMNNTSGYIGTTLIELEPSVLATEFAAWLVIVILLLWQFVKVVMTMVFRYITLGITINLSPLCMGFAASDSTSIIPKSWLKTMLAQTILFFVTAWAMYIMYGALQTGNQNEGELLTRLVFVYAFGKITLKLDELLNRLGFATMPTADNARSGMAGVIGMGLMAARMITRSGGSSGGGKDSSPAGPNSGSKFAGQTEGKKIVPNSSTTGKIEDNKIVPNSNTTGKIEENKIASNSNTSGKVAAPQNIDTKSEPKVENKRIQDAPDRANMTAAKAAEHDIKAANLSLETGAPIDSGTLDNALGISESTGIKLMGDATPSKDGAAWTSKAKIPSGGGSYTDGEVTVSLGGSGVYEENSAGQITPNKIEHDEFNWGRNWEVHDASGASTGVTVHEMKPVRNEYTESRRESYNSSRKYNRSQKK